MWVRDHEPQIYARTAKTLCAKDYINYRLTGRMATGKATRTLREPMRSISIGAHGRRRFSTLPVLPEICFQSRWNRARFWER